MGQLNQLAQSYETSNIKETKPSTFHGWFSALKSLQETKTFSLILQYYIQNLDCSSSDLMTFYAINEKKTLEIVDLP